MRCHGQRLRTLEPAPAAVFHAHLHAAARFGARALLDFIADQAAAGAGAGAMAAWVSASAATGGAEAETERQRPW